MASVETADRDRTLSGRGKTPSRVTHDETKAWFKTTELLTMLGVVLAILIASAVADNFDAPRAWTLVAIVSSAYVVARGLAKSGSSHADTDRWSESVRKEHSTLRAGGPPIGRPPQRQTPMEAK